MAESATNNDEFLYFTVEGLRYEGLCGFYLVLSLKIL